MQSATKTRTSMRMTWPGKSCKSNEETTMMMTMRTITMRWSMAYRKTKPCNTLKSSTKYSYQDVAVAMKRMKKKRRRRMKSRKTVTKMQTKRWMA